MPTTRNVKKNKVKEIRRDSFNLDDWDKYVITGMAQTMNQMKEMISVHEQQLDLMKSTLASAQTSVTDYLARKAVKDWDFDEGPELSFEDFSLEDGKVTVVQYEAKDVPKVGAETNDANAEQPAPAGAKTGSDAQTEEA